MANSFCGSPATCHRASRREWNSIWKPAALAALDTVISKICFGR
jgi:hypothetical protein